MRGDSKRDWEQVEPLLDKALDLDDTERRRFLDEVGEQDPLLLDRLRALLRASEEESALMIDKPLHSVAGGLVGKVPIAKLDPTLGPGKIVGVYRILEELGEGGMGRVFLAERADGEFRQRVALKVLNEPAETAGESYSRFRRERQILADLKHEGIARLLDGGVTRDGRPFFVLEYVDGVPLVEHCRRQGLPIDERVSLVLQVCEALQYAHRRGVVHRDLKPSNLLVEDDPERGRRVCVLDFGIAHHGPAHEITLSGQIMGTPGYMAPEQAKGLSHLVDRRSDIFSLGVVLYELLSGRQPFGGESVSAADVLVRVAEVSFEPLSSVVSGIPPALEAIVERCLAKRPEDRYESMRALADDLTAFLGGRPLGSPDRRSGEPGRRARRRSALRLAGVAGLVALLGLLAFLAWRARGEAERRRLVDGRLEVAREVSDLVRRAHLSEGADLGPVRAEVERRLAALGPDAEAGSTEVAAAAHYARGLGALELGDSRAALEHLGSAWRQGRRTTDTAAALVAAAADRAALARALADLGVVGETPAPISEALRDDILARLEGAGEGAGERLRSEASDALRARLEGRHDEVTGGVERLVAREPWRYEALLMAADSVLSLAGAADGDERAARTAEAEELLRRAAEQGRSDPRVDDRLCALGLSGAVGAVGGSGSGGGGAQTVVAAPARAAVDRALEPCRRALRLDPERYEPRLLIAAATAAAAPPDFDTARRELDDAARLGAGDPLLAEVRRFVEARRGPP